MPFRWVLPPACCACLGPADVTHQVSSFYGEGGKSMEAKFDVPMCRACRARMQTRERLAYLAALLAAGLGAWFVSPQAPVAADVRSMLTVPAAVVLAVGFLGFLGVALGRPFEPASFVEGRPRFRNGEYQRRFEEANPAPG